MGTFYEFAAQLPQLSLPNFVFGIIIIIIIQLLAPPYVDWFVILSFWVWTMVKIIELIFPEKKPTE